MVRCRRVVVAALVVALAAGVTSGLSGCSVLLTLSSHQPSTEENLANQRNVAQQIIRDYPNPALESIRFTKEGHVDGSGGWSANAVVTIDGKEYQASLGTLVSAGDAFPMVTRRTGRCRVIAAALALTIAAGITKGLSGCSIFGGTMDEQRPTNVANQRKAAIDFIRAHPEIEGITFTQEGSVSGSGTWAANALVLVDEDHYQAILGIGIGSTSWEPWPSQSPRPTPTPVTVTYSDGTSEVLK